jgi:hypothetical protein
VGEHGGGKKKLIFFFPNPHTRNFSPAKKPMPEKSQYRPVTGRLDVIPYRDDVTIPLLEWLPARRYTVYSLGGAADA